MDENKEILTPENEAEEVSAEVNTESAEETAAAPENTKEAPEETEAAPEETEAALEDAEDASETNEGIEEFAPKSNKTLQRTIAISAGIVICAVLVAIVCRLFLFHGVVDTDLFGNSKETCWHYTAQLKTQQTAATSDEPMTAEYYFMFEPDGTLKIEIGTFDFYGNYAIRHLTDEDVANMALEKENIGKTVLDIENSNSIDGVYYYDVSGNVFTGKTMTITSVSNEEFSIDFDNKAYEPAKVEREGEFKKDEAIVGSWTNKNEIASQTLKFSEDGSYSIDTNSTDSHQTERGLYSCEDGKLKLTSFYTTTQSNEFKYSFEKEKLIITQVIALGDQTIEQPIEYTKD